MKNTAQTEQSQTGMRDKIRLKLESAGIRSLLDIDVYARHHKSADNSIPSRYDVLCQLVGENVAIAMLHELSLRQCTGIGR